MNRSLQFTVPAGAGAYAPEVLYLNADNAAGSMPDTVHDLVQHIASLPATAVVEVDVLKPGGNSLTAADWRTAVKTNNTVGLKDAVRLFGWTGVRIRVKSGGTGGAAVVDASWSTQAA